MPIIYRTVNKVNGKVYVGIHCTSKKDGYLGSGIKLLRAIKKYGRANFERDTLERCPIEKVLQREAFWIRKLHASDPKVGYNLSEDGTGCYRKGFIPWNKGKKGYLSEKVLEKLRLAGRSEQNRLNHKGRRNGTYLRLHYSVIRSFLKDYNFGYSIQQASERHRITRKKGCNLLKEYSFLVLPEEERRKKALQKQIQIIREIFRSIDFNKALLYYMSKEIANRTHREPSFVRRFLSKLGFKATCKCSFGKRDVSLFSSHNFALLLKETGKYKGKRKPLIRIK